MKMRDEYEGMEVMEKNVGKSWSARIVEIMGAQVPRMGTRA